jgi:site-specific DNA recombinase
MPTTAIYTRVSTKKQASKGFSLDAQENIGKEICERNKWTYKIFAERGQSADKETLDNRPALEEILDIAEDKKIQYLFVTELNRLSRSPVTLAYIKKVLSENNVKVVTPSQTFDFQNDEDDFITDLLGILAKRENRVRVKRSIRAKNEAVLLGRWIGGAATAFGWTRQRCEGDRLKHNQLMPDPETSKIYLQMVDWALRGISTIEIARRLNDSGVQTTFSKVSRQGKKYFWHAGTIWEILKNPLYKGDYKYGDASTKIPGIIPTEKWQAVQDALRSNCSSAGRNTKRFYLLRGLLTCKRCGRRLFGRTNPRRKTHTYNCLSKRPDPHPRFCGLRNIPIDIINKLVWDETVNIVMHWEDVKKKIRKQLKETGNKAEGIEVEIRSTERKIAGADQQISRIVELYARGTIPAEDLDRNVKETSARRDSLKTKLSELQLQLANEGQKEFELDYIRDYIDSLKKRIDTFTEQEQYDLLHTIIDKIIVDYNEETDTHKYDIEYAVPIENQPGGNAPIASCRSFPA